MTHSQQATRQDQDVWFSAPDFGFDWEEVLASQRPGNRTEGEAYQRLVDAGWLVFSRGLPDLVAFRMEDGYVGGARFVEVKSSTDQLRPSQQAMLYMLSNAGIRAEAWWHKPSDLRWAPRWRVEDYAEGP